MTKNDRSMTDNSLTAILEIDLFFIKLRHSSKIHDMNYRINGALRKYPFSANYIISTILNNPKLYESTFITVSSISAIFHTFRSCDKISADDITYCSSAIKVKIFSDKNEIKRLITCNAHLHWCYQLDAPHKNNLLSAILDDTELFNRLITNYNELINFIESFDNDESIINFLLNHDTIFETFIDSIPPLKNIIANYPKHADNIKQKYLTLTQAAVNRIDIPPVAAKIDEIPTAVSHVHLCAQ